MCRLAIELPQQHLQAVQNCGKAVEVLHCATLKLYAAATCDEINFTQMAVHQYWLVLQAYNAIACCAVALTDAACCPVALMQPTCTASIS